MGLCLLCVLVLLGGCASQDKETQSQTLPTPSPAEAPYNDSMQDAVRTVLLYLPSADGDKLVTVPVEEAFSVSRHPAEKLCRLLYEHPGNDYAAALPEGVELSSAQPVEVTGNTVTVSLAPGALRLTKEEMFLVCQATANTLGQMEDVQYVNVLINGVQPGLDLAATQPAGCFQQAAQTELDVLHNRMIIGADASRKTIAAALYYPAAGSRGIVCEARPLSFDSLESAQMLKTILSALAEGPVSLQGLPRFPDFFQHLEGEPRVVQENGAKRVVLHFKKSLNDALPPLGMTQSVMAASLVYTFTTFMPGVEGVEIHIGDEMLQSLTTLAGETIEFENGLMKRSDMTGFLYSDCTLYFAGDDGMLHRVTRMVPYYEARNVRFIIHQLMAGPQKDDGTEKLQSVLPKGLREADLLGVTMDGDTLVLHFSEQLVILSKGMGQQQERNMVYAMVNSLCELPYVKKVRFMVNGGQPEALAGYLYLPGNFLPNPDIVSDK